MPFKGMLKWAVAKEDHPSKTKSSTKSLRKRRKLSHHHHYCSILKSGVCLRIENAAPSSKANGGATSLSSSSSTALRKGEVEDSKSSRRQNKLISGGVGGGISRSSGSGANNTNSNNNNNNINCCRGLHHHHHGGVQRSASSSSSRFRLKVARHWSAGSIINMGNSVVKSADNNDHDCVRPSPLTSSSSSTSTSSSSHCATCPSTTTAGNNANSLSSSSSHITPNNANNNTSKQNNNNNSAANNTTSRNNARNRMLSGSPSSSPSGGNIINKNNGFQGSCGNGAGGGDRNNVGGNADSKSLLYMSLDHLPLAIVKQYERMLQESTTLDDALEQEQPVGSKGSEKASMKVEQVVLKDKLKKSKKERGVPPVHDDVKKCSSNGRGLPTEANAPSSSVIKNRPSIIKQKEGSNGTNQGVVASHPKKIMIISPPKSKRGSCSVQTETKNLPCTTTVQESIEPTKNNKKSHPATKSSTFSNNNCNANVSIKEARSRPLQVSSVSTSTSSPRSSSSLRSSSSKKKSESTKRKSPSPEELVNEKCTQTGKNTGGGGSPKPKSRFKVTIVNSPTLTSSSSSTSTSASCTSSCTISKKAIGVNDVERRDASCETEPKLFPLKSILKDCKSSTLPRTKSEHLKPKKDTSSNSHHQSTDKNVTIYGRSSSFRTTDKGKSKEDIASVSSRKPFQSLHNISIARDEEYDDDDGKAFNTFAISPQSSPPLRGVDLLSTTIANLNTTTSTTPLNDHDVTDPQFLEMPVPISTPAVSRCAKKLTLKRSEIRKLEKIRTQTEKLNRFLKKYYHDCLPNLPEEEEEQCSPEEKSVHLSVLRTHWIEKKPEDISTSSSSSSEKQQQQQHPGKVTTSRQQRRNTLPHTNFPLQAAAAIAEAARVLSAGESLNQNADCSSKTTTSSSIHSHHQDNAIRVEKNNQNNSSLLSSSAYYSDPVLSSLPIIIEDPELLLHHFHQQQEENKSNKNSGTFPTTRSSSCCSILINNNNNKTQGIVTSTSASENSSASSPSPTCRNACPHPLNGSDSRCSTAASCSCSCTESTSSSSSNFCNGKCTSSTTTSIINLANEFRMAEVIRRDNNIHESFLMSTHNFPLEDNSALFVTSEKEFGGAAIQRCIPTVNDHQSESLLLHINNRNSEMRAEDGGGPSIDSFAIQVTPVAITSRKDLDDTEECEDLRRKNKTKTARKSALTSDNNNNEGRKNKRSSGNCEDDDDDDEGSKSKKVMIPFASCNSSVGSSSGTSCSNSINSEEHDDDDDDHHGIIGEDAPDHCFGAEKLKGFTMMGREEPLGNPFDVPTSLAEDEGFMSPYPPEAYSPASSSSSTSLLNRLSISSGKGSAEDYDDERRLELFFLDSSCEASLMVEQQIAAYTKQQEYHHPADLIPGEEESHHHLLEQGHECEEDENAGGGVIIISNHYNHPPHEKNPNFLDKSVDIETKEEEEDGKLEGYPSHHIPFPILPQPRRNCINARAITGNSNYHLSGACEGDEKGNRDETWNSHDYATIGSSSSSTTSGSTSTYAACGSFFPNSNLLENHHERQGSSDSSLAAYSSLNECENDDVDHNPHPHHQSSSSHHHQQQQCDLYENVDVVKSSVAAAAETFGDNDYNDSNDEAEQEESVIIQSSLGSSTTGGAGIAFSTPIARARPQQSCWKAHHYHPRLIMKPQPARNNYSQCSNASTTNANSFSFLSSLHKSSFCSSAVSATSNRSTRSRTGRYRTPRKLVKKPPVKTPFSDKGEVLIRCYRNGDYVTVHVVQAKNLQVCYRSSWKLSMKISLIPEGEATFTKSESVVVRRARSFVRIEQKFSFEIPQPTKSHNHHQHPHHTEDNCTGGAGRSLGARRGERKIFLTFVKRIEKRSTFLGWTTLEVPDLENTTQCWLKLRKRKMSSVSYPAHSSSLATSNHFPHNHSSSAAATAAGGSGGGLVPGPSPIAIVTAATPPGSGGVHQPTEAMVGLPSHIETLDQGVIPSVPSRSCKSPDSCYEQEYQLGKTQLQNSSTMDSGVEDCCEPPPVPSIELDDKLGFRVRVHMTKQEGAGFGFSVVWVSPPRIERLEKDKTADLAGLKIGDLIIGVNGEDVTTVPNTTIYNKMKSTGKELDLEIWRKHPHVASPLPPHLTAPANIPHPIHPATCGVQPPPPPPHHQPSLPPAVVSKTGVTTASSSDCRDHRPTVHNSTTTSTALPQNNSYNCNNIKNTTTSGLPMSSPPVTGGGAAPTNPLLSRIHHQPPPPTSILKPPPPAPPVSASNVGNACPSQSQQPTTGSSAWRIRFNIELLDNEDDYLKQFFICELKYFRKVVAALDRYLIPAQANRLLTPQEIHLIFAQVIKIITMTKRILQCVANGSNSSSWKLGRILLSTHSDHLPEIIAAYSAYAKSLAYSAVILSEKMSIQDFAKFVLETTVPKGHLDMTSLLFAPFEHLRNLCEICEEISHHHDNWVFLNTRLKECYADIVCETDFMEPISHLSMKKNPLLSVRDLEKRIISTTSQQPLKVCEKGRKWLFGSRLYRREQDGSWSPVWAFLFTDIIVLTSHMTRDRVFFVKEAPIRLDDVVTLHFNLPKKHEHEFRLLFGPDTSHHSRLDRILPLVRTKKPNQVVLRTANVQLKSLWKLLLQRQIISLNTRLSKSSSSNFSISEFCEKFPVVQHDSIMEEDEEKVEGEQASVPMSTATPAPNKLSPHPQLKSAKTITTAQMTPISTELHPHSLRSTMSAKPQLDYMTRSKAPLSTTGVTREVVVSSPKVGAQAALSGSEVKQQQQPDERLSKDSQPEKNVTSPTAKPYIPDGLSIINKDLMRARIVRPSGDRKQSIPGDGVISLPRTAGLGSDTEKGYSSTGKVIAPPPLSAVDRVVVSTASQSNTNGPISSATLANSPQIPSSAASAKAEELTATKTETVINPAKVTSVTRKSITSKPTLTDATTSTPDNLYATRATSTVTIPPVPKARTSLSNAAHNTPTHSPRTSTPAPESSSSSPIPSHNNNNTIDNVNQNERKNGGEGVCPCEKLHSDTQQLLENATTAAVIKEQQQQPTAYPSPKPRQLSNLRRMSSREESTQTAGKNVQHPPANNNEKVSEGKVTAQGSRTISKAPHNHDEALQAGNDLRRKGENNDSFFSPEVVAPPSPAAAASQSKSYAKEAAHFSKEQKFYEQIPEPLQSPLMVKRAQALASGTDTPSSSSSLSPARLPGTIKGNNRSANNNEMESLTDGVNNAYLKSKPGSRIMTNAILKSRQQELIAQSLQGTSVSTETLRTEKSSDTTASTSKDSSTQYFSLKDESTTTSTSSTQSQPQQIMVRCIHNKNIIVHHQHHSHHCPGHCAGSSAMMMSAGGGMMLAPGSPHLSVPPRCHSENSHHPKKSKPVHTDSPIISGYGSERARRRMLFDNKVRKDYPELFGITPKDRRSFIKQLGEKDLNSKGLVAPYYYTMSPVPTRKDVMMTMGNSTNIDSSVSIPTKQGSESDNGNKKSSPLVIPPFNPNSHAKGPIKSNEERGGLLHQASTKAGTISPSADIMKVVVVGSGSSNNGKQTLSGTSITTPPRSSRESIEVEAAAGGSKASIMCQSSEEGSSVSSSTLRHDPALSPAAAGGGSGGDDEDDCGSCRSDDAIGNAAQIAHDVYQASLELDDEGQRLKDFVEKMREEMTVGGVGMDDDDDDDEDDEEDEDEDEEEEEEDSDDSTAGGHEGERGQSHRSHEESSNDSGISDEMTEKSKTTMSGLLEEDEDPERSLSLSISRRNENFSNMLDRMRSGVLEAEVKNPTNPDKISSTAVSNSTTPVANNTVHIIDTNNAPDDSDGNNVVDNCSPNNDANRAQIASANHPSHCCTTNNKSHIDETTSLCFLEGETKASVETMVVLKADKATETEDDDFNFLLAMNTLRECSHASHNINHHQHSKPLRSILAERREAFFLSQQSSFTSAHCPFVNMSTATMSGHSIHFAEDSAYISHLQHSHHVNAQCSECGSCGRGGGGGVYGGVSAGVPCVNCDPSQQQNRDPLIVKIVDGGTLHSIEEKKDPPPPEAPCERVQLQRLEQRKKAKVERVESSEDSTSSSSDLASASPAAENGTTDPSWSSSSSSLAGYASSKEEPLQIIATTTSAIVAASVSVACSTNTTNVAAGTTVPPAAASTISSSSSSSYTSASAAAAAAVVAPSLCSQCSNINKDSISSGSSCSTSAQTHSTNNGEPSSSYQSTSSKSYSILVDPDPGKEEQQRLQEQQQLISSSSCSRSTNDTSTPPSPSVKKLATNDDNNSCATNNNNSNNNIASCSHSQGSASSNPPTNNNSEMNQSFEYSEIDSSTSCSSISNSNTTGSKVTLLTSSKKSTTNSSCSTTTTSSSYLSRSSGSSSASSSRVVVVTGGAALLNEGDDDDHDDDDEEVEDGNGSERSCARTGPEIVVTQESDPEDSSHSSNDNGNTRHGYSSDGEEDSIVCNGKAADSVASDENGGGSSAGEGGGSACSSIRSSASKGGFLRVESNDSTAENYGDDDDYNFDDEDDEDDLSHCSVATINRYGTFESLEKLESEDTVGGLPDFPRSMPRSKARFTFEDDDDDDDDDLFEEDFESDFNFRFPSQIQDNTYSVSRLGPLPPLLEEDYEDDMYDETRPSGVSPSSSGGMGEFSGGVGGSGNGGGCSSNAASLRNRHEISTVGIQRVSFSTDPATIISAPSYSLASPPATSPISSRSQKLVLIQSSEMIVIAEATKTMMKDGNNSSSGPKGAQAEASQSDMGKIGVTGNSSMSKIDCVASGAKASLEPSSSSTGPDFTDVNATNTCI